MARLLAPYLAVLCLSGCIIGTWPVPEDAPKDPHSGSPLGDEACNNADDDADGSVDEGCPCSQAARGCVGITGGQCGLGVQWCSGEGVWQACSDIFPPYVPARTPGVRLEGLDPARMLRGAIEPLQVTVSVVPACDGIIVPSVPVTLAAQTPVMRVRAVALDDGVPPDAVAGDELYTVELPNPFGPGVPAQELSIGAEVELSGEIHSDDGVVPLEDP
jgi:hypothetical protein